MKTRQMGVDNTDRRILVELRKDCRRSYRSLAKAIGLSPAALIERIKRLEKDDVIVGYGVRLDYLKLGFEFMAVVRINISGRDLMAVEKRIAKMPHVAAIWDTTGEYDAIAVVMCKSRNELSATVKKMLALPGVEGTNTNMVLNTVSRLTDFEEV